MTRCRKWIQTAGLALSLCGLATPGATALDEATARDLVAAHLGVSPDRTHVTLEEKPLPLTRRSITLVKTYVDLGGGELDDALLAVDEGQRVVEPGHLLAAEAAAAQALYGKQEPALWRQTSSSLDPGRQFLVHVFLRSTPELREAIQEETRVRHDVAGRSPEEHRALVDAARRARLAVAESIVAPAASAVTALGGQVVEEFAVTHSLVAGMTAAQIQQLEERPDVMRIADNDKTVVEESDVTWRSLGMASLWTRPLVANGIGVAVVEGSAVNDPSPYLHNLLAVRDNTCEGSHPTQVAHSIAADQDHWRGTAPFANIVSANHCSFTYGGLQTAMNWALTNHDPQIYNHSYGAVSSDGSLDSMDQFLDQFAEDNRETQVKSAGNVGSSCLSPGFFISHPGLGYNTLTVGALDDGNSLPRGNDVMAAFSCFAEGEGSAKPEVTAPGTNIKWYLDGPPRTGNPPLFAEASGTSFSAPATAGLAAIVEDARPCNFWSAPTSHKAAIMATAVFDVENGFGGNDRDGVGAVHGGSLANLLDHKGAGCYDDNISADIDLTVPLSALVADGANPTVRAVLTWSEDPSGPHRSGLPYPGDPQSDWDLAVLDPGNSFVAGSTSFGNTWEAVEFVVNASGNWTFRLNNFGDSGILHTMALFWVVKP